MRHPAKKRNISLLLLLICIAVALLGNFVFVSYLNSGGQSLMNVGLLTLGVFSLTFWGIYASAASGYRKLMAGHGMLTQWMVSQEDWRIWLAYHDKLAPMNPRYPNDLWINRNPSVDGVEVVLGEESVVVDGDFQWLPMGASEMQFDSLGVEPGPPSFMNMHITTTRYTKQGTTRTQHALRFPVPVEAREDAMAALHWYVNRSNEMAVNRGSLATKYPVATRNICIVIAILSAVACFVGFYCRNQPQLLDQNWAVGFAVTGVLVTPAALFMAWVAHGALKTQRKQAEYLAAQQASQQTTAPPPPPAA